MRYVLGFDQGGSKTHAIILDEEGHAAGFGTGCGANHAATGLDFAMDCIEEAARQAFADSGLTPGDIACVGAGITGVDWDYETELIGNAIAARLGIRPVFAVNDCIGAMRAGTEGTVSAVICAGSGLNCAVRNGDELFVYGYYIPPTLGGGASLGAAALQAVFDAQAGLAPETSLTDAVLACFKLDSVDELMRRRESGKVTFRDLMALVRILGDTAAAGDEVSIRIWESFGKGAARCITARAGIMNMLMLPVEVVLSGGVFKTPCSALLSSITKEIRSCMPNAVITQAAYEPVVGAALLALDKLFDNRVPGTVYENLDQSAEKYSIRRR